MEGTMAEVRLFAGNFAPRNWAFCEGQLLAISTYNALFSLLGTIYGGDGRTTFALPDLRGRTAVGQGQGAGLSFYRLGSRTGSIRVSLNSITMPSHNHTATTNLTATAALACNNAGADSDEPEGTFPGTPTGETPYNANGDLKMALAASVVTGNIMAGNAGNSGSHENMMPTLTSSYVICIAGIYPSRN